MFSVLMEGCHVGYSLEFVGMVYCTYGQSNATCEGVTRIMWHNVKRDIFTLAAGFILKCCAYMFFRHSEAVIGS